jgi:hypothetical protein
MDASAVLISSMLYVFPHVPRSRKHHTPKQLPQVGSLVLDMVTEIIRLLQRLDQVLVNDIHFVWSHAVIKTLVSNALGLSQWGMEMTGNTSMDIQQRISSSSTKQSCILQYRTLLQPWAAQTAWHEWQGLVLESPVVGAKRRSHHHDDHDQNGNNSSSSSSSSSSSNKDHHHEHHEQQQQQQQQQLHWVETSCQQLVLYLGLAEVVGMSLATDMPTIWQVVCQLQGRLDKTYVLPPPPLLSTNNPHSSNSNSLMNRRLVQDAPHVGETMSPPSLGLFTPTHLMTFLSSSLVPGGADHVLVAATQQRIDGGRVLRSRL